MCNVPYMLHMQVMVTGSGGDALRQYTDDYCFSNCLPAWVVKMHVRSRHKGQWWGKGKWHIIWEG